LSAQVRYLVLVISGGALGSALHDLSSFMNVIANRSFPKNWLWSYLFRILLAVPLALAFYVLIRGGILTPEAGTNVLNPYGILIASVLVGTFAAPIIDKLLAVEQTLLGQESQLERQIDRIGEALGVTALDNYRGFVCISFQGEGGEGVRFMDSTKPVLRAGRLYELVVWFEPSKPEQGVAEEIRIEGGTNAKEVTFTLAPNSDRFGLRPRQKAVSFGVMEPSPFAQFQFYAPQAPDPHELWVEVSQKNRLVHVASATFYVEGVEQPSND
jgi:hypothetical protein